MANKMAAVQMHCFISSIYISFQVVQLIAFRYMPASMLGFLVHKCTYLSARLEQTDFVKFNARTGLKTSSLLLSRVLQLPSIREYYTICLCEQPHPLYRTTGAAHRIHGIISILSAYGLLRLLSKIHNMYNVFRSAYIYACPICKGFPDL